jgi:hypothetical protein
MSNNCPTIVQQKKELIMSISPINKGFLEYKSEWVSVPPCPP